MEFSVEARSGGGGTCYFILHKRFVPQELRNSFKGGVLYTCLMALTLEEVKLMLIFVKSVSRQGIRRSGSSTSGSNGPGYRRITLPLLS